MSEAPTSAPALPPAPEPHRSHVLLVATLLAIAAGTMLFGALLASYFAAKDAAEVNGVWPPDGVTIPNVALIMTYVTLLMSSVTAQWAVAAIRAGDRRQMYLAIGLTVGLGLAFVNGLSFCWSELGLVAGADSYANAVYSVTVTHLVVVIAAHVMFLVMGFRAFGGQFSPSNSEFVSAAAAVWHFAVASGAVIWISLWFLESGPAA